VRIETVLRIAEARGIDPRTAREHAVSDALFALEGERSVDPAVAHAGKRSAHSRALLEAMQRAARAEGPPRDSELDELLRERWVALDRPESVRVVHAVALFPKDGTPDEARRVGLELSRALAGISDPAEFLKKAQEFPDQAVSLRAERLPPFTADGRAFRVGAMGTEPAGNFEPVFTRAAHALAAPGAQSDLVETRYGFHVILLEERLPPQSIPREDQRRVLFEDVVTRRAASLRRALLEQLESRVRIEVSRNFEALTSSLGPTR
jgi:hypothetical protein